MMPKETIVCAYAQPASGPGWGNSPLWYIVRDGNGKLTQKCLQPDEQTAEIALLYRISSEVHNAMVYAVEKATAKKPRKAR
jgi:hypothetical protein